MSAPRRAPAAAWLDDLEQKTTRLLRSKQAAIVGVLVGLICSVLVASSLVRAISRGSTLLDEQTLGSLGLSAIGFMLFQILAVWTLHATGGRPALRLWASSQLAKYLPAPGAALGGMVHGSIRTGGTVGDAVRITVRHSALLLGAAIAVGGSALGEVTHSSLGWPAWVPVALLLPVGVALMAFSLRGRDSVDRYKAAFAAVAAWLVLGALLWAGVARNSPGAWTMVSAFAAAWAAGFVVLPVPAGLGVREAVLFVLLEPSMGSAGAASFAVLSRMLHVGSDAVVIGASALIAGWRGRT